MEELEASVTELKRIIWAHDGENVADAAFRRQVDALLSLFYDDIGEIKRIPLRSLFDLFVIKVLYVERRSRDASVIDYLGDLLTRYLFARELAPWLRDPRRYTSWLQSLMTEAQDLGPFQNLFEAYRKHGDNYLFLTGLFPRAFRRRGAAHRLRHLVPLSLDRSYYITWGKSFYRLASKHALAEVTGQRQTLDKLSTYFEIYMDALNDMSDRYILGFDMNLIADKMLDSFNLYRKTGEDKYLDNARKYAALLKLDASRFPSLFRRRSRPVIL